VRKQRRVARRVTIALLLVHLAVHFDAEPAFRAVERKFRMEKSGLMLVVL
jgi:hypothetical protein